MDWVKYAYLPYCTSLSHTYNQRYGPKPAPPRCSVCDLQFAPKGRKEKGKGKRKGKGKGKEDGKGKVSLSLQMIFHNCLLTFYQYFDADHRFECTECDREFLTGVGRDMVRSFCRLVN